MRTRLRAEFFGEVCAARSKRESVIRVGEIGGADPQQTVVERKTLAY
jgi:hypothetical protein